MRKLLFRSLLGVVAAGFPAGLPAALAQGGAVEVTDAWARATSPAATTGGVYLTVVARGGADALEGFSSPVAAHAELHRTVDDKGIMKMLPVERLALPAGTPVALSPGGYHVMLMELRHPLVRGSSFPLTVQFEHASPQTVTVTVEGPGAMREMMHHK